MLLALACFNRGSPRLREWLLAHPRFGPPLRRWNTERTIPLRAKVTALAMMTASLAGILAFSSLPALGKAGVAAFIAVGMVVVGRLPLADPSLDAAG
ncbi:MAG: YbaN family protein, partial [Myxococcota bacterium]